MSAEDWLQEVAAVIKTYRDAEKVGPATAAAARSEALARLRKLHLTEGDAVRYLDAKGKR
jgi:hypothetical protein